MGLVEQFLSVSVHFSFSASVHVATSSIILR